jgi:hypothetical protein
MGDDMSAAKRKSSAARGARSMCVRGVKYAVGTARDILYAINKCKTIKSCVKQIKCNVPERERCRSLQHELCSSAAPLPVPEFITAVRQKSYPSITIDRRRSKHCMAPQIKLLFRVVLEHNPYHAAPWLRQQEFAS